MVTNNCTVCQHPKKEEIVQAVLQGTTLRSVIAKMYSVSLSDINIHINDHLFVNEDDEIVVSEPPQRLKPLSSEEDALISQLSMLSDRVWELNQLGKTDRNVNNQIAKLVKETRGHISAIKDLREKGRAREQITMEQYNTLKAFVLSMLCDPCKVRLAKVLLESEAEALSEYVEQPAF